MQQRVKKALRVAGAIVLIAVMTSLFSMLLQWLCALTVSDVGFRPNAASNTLTIVTATLVLVTLALMEAALQINGFLGCFFALGVLIGYICVLVWLNSLIFQGTPVTGELMHVVYILVVLTWTYGMYHIFLDKPDPLADKDTIINPK